MIPRGLHVHMAGESCPITDCGWAAAPVMPGGESTSAQLRQTQSALAASQTDLTRVEQERDEAVRRAADLEQVREELKQLRLVSDGYREDIQQLESGQDAVIDSLRIQRDTARAELEQLRAAACPDPAAHTTTEGSTDA